MSGLVGDGSKGLKFDLVLLPFTHKRHTVQLKFPKDYPANNISSIVLTGSPRQELLLYIDNITLLKGKGETKDEQHPYASQQLINIWQEKVNLRVPEVQSYIATSGLRFPTMGTFLSEQVRQEKNLSQKPDITWDQRLAVLQNLSRVKLTADRFKQVQQDLQNYRGNKRNGYLVGFQDSMTKIMPRHLLPNLKITNEVSLDLAGNEKEAFQVAVVPYSKNASQVKVSVSELKSSSGVVLKQDNIDVDLVGFTETKMKTEPAVDYVGWYPDPIIPTREGIDVALGDAQSWWVRVRAPKDFPAGVYKGKITVMSKGGSPEVFDLKVRVYGFNVPPHAPIPTAVTYMSGEKEKKIASIGSEANWEKLKYKHTDFIADYYLNIDNIYLSPTATGTAAIDWDLLLYLHRKGQLISFNLGHFYWDDDKHINSFKANYDKAKELGLIDHAYIYGFDERPSSEWQVLERAAKKIKERYPGVIVMTTSQDKSFGLDSVLKTVDAFVPILPSIDSPNTKQARAVGKKVWWYTCIWPPHPYPNIFVEYPNIDNRVLTGIMQARYKPDGFLYYNTTSWKTGEGINKYPYTNWNPNSFGKTNGDGSYFAIDKDGNPLATVRVENYRDGLEDLAYYMILRYKVDLAKQSKITAMDGWIKQVEAALQETQKYVPNFTDWTKDPKDIYAYRSKLAQLIEASPIKDDNPWKNGMGVRGLEFWNQ